MPVRSTNLQVRVTACSKGKEFPQELREEIITRINRALQELPNVRAGKEEVRRIEIIAGGGRRSVCKFDYTCSSKKSK